VPGRSLPPFALMFAAVSVAAAFAGCESVRHSLLVPQCRHIGGSDIASHSCPAPGRSRSMSRQTVSA
jgi:hypothetical protein